jgi:hypothetical protein
METRASHPLTLLLIIATAVLGANSSQAARGGDNGHGRGRGQDRGERITLTDGTAGLRERVENLVIRVPLFSIDDFKSSDDDQDRARGHEVSRFRTTGITGRQAIRGIRAGSEDGHTFTRNNRSSGPRNGWIDGIRGHRDLVDGGTRPIPEPSAALVFGLGTLVACTALRRRA